MEIYEYDMVAIVIFLFGLGILFKGKLSFTIEVDRGGIHNTFSKSSRVIKIVKLGALGGRILGILLVLLSAAIYIAFKEKLLLIL